ncbi:L,D-transpeptidase family protein [Labrys monachus]|uniref:Murein L,D-transpeptidase YafK n=1 Tax=Labrys monachus TaxID=217067 RepID=A0ABU0FNU6_9HYPH|nr:murein L,D-transpeptidase family protein [Labrys monachus]MDQ0396290.1 murein L,D-transpeptidase YafK [Labrys monachus]
MTAHLTLMRKIALAAGIMLLAASCSQNGASLRSTTPIPEALRADMAAKDMPRSAPILVRVYKKESELELWKQTSSGHFALLKTYPICRWSGQLGPKKNEGDRQVPEGFYSVGQSQLNPNSNYYLSFDVGYPNNFDRQLGRAGGNIMVHGSCSSRGCFAMTDGQMAELYSVAREALQGGQPAFQLQSYPFRMTAENLAQARRNPNIGFWQNLKEGSDNFEVTKQAVKVDVCKGRYVFNGENGTACGLSPISRDVATAVIEKKRHDDAEVASLVNSGTRAVSYIYEDGGANPAFLARAVDQTAVPGKDRPFTSAAVVEVALNDNGTPATEADTMAAKRITYSAAEELLMSEAAVARRPLKGPANPDAVAARQQVVYARLLGTSMPVAPKKPVTVVARADSAAPTPAQEIAAATSDDNSKPFYVRWLGGSGDEAETKPAQSVAQAQSYGPVLVPHATRSHPKQRLHNSEPVKFSGPVMASAGTVATMPAPLQNQSSDQPFYKRWLGFADDTPATTGAN